ncbi:MAG: DEAD/DEAH box helicase [bacterium]|nr:DEAD/DEAH box helicase [bacterium]
MIMLFQEIGLKKGLLRSIESKAYYKTTTIQEKVITLALQGKNIVGQSQT